MKKQFFTFCILLAAATASVSQTGTAFINKDSVKPDQKLYFPASSYSDSIALNQAIPHLAEQIIAAYAEPDKKTYFDNSINYELLAGNYKKAIDLMDSIQAIDDDKSYDIELRSYALARIHEKKQDGSFEKLFQKEFSDAYTPLSFRKKVRIAFLDSAMINDLSTDYLSVKEKLQKNNKDSLSVEDARSLADKFFYFTIYNKIFPLMHSLVDPQYRKMFPAIKTARWAAVVPVQGIDEIPDPNMEYKLLFELTGFAYKGQDSSAKKEINAGLSEVARQINLHVAAGIPKKNMNAVVVAHGDALNILLNNEKYKKKYGIDNPNIPLIRELQNYGVKIIVCGQAMTFFRLENEDLVPGIKLALTAQTVLSSYQLQGFVYRDESLRDE